MRLSHLRRIYLLFILLLAIAVGIALAQGGRLHTDLDSLLPQQEQTDALQKAAKAAQQQEIQQQILLLIGAADESKAIGSAAHLADMWRDSGLFNRIDAQQNPNLAELQQQIQALGVAALPQAEAQILLEQPQAYFRARAEAVLNPFAPAVLPLQEDWLGFARFVFERQPQLPLQWHADSGFFSTQAQGKTWIWLRAHLAESPNPSALLSLLTDSRRYSAAQGTELLAGGGAFFSAATQRQAESESRYMSLAGLSLTFTLIAFLWRSWRLAAVLLPLAAGILCGFAACLAVFGHIHALSLVIGSSLIGVLVDFPLHWLAPTLFAQPWQAADSMRRIAPTFALSLGITALGYGLLFFSPLAVLQETAIFSAAALFGAFTATALLLPPLFAHMPCRSSPMPRLMQGMIDLLRRLHHLPALIQSALLCLIVLLILGGLWHSRWQDDIRDWAKLDPALLADTQRIAEIAAQAQTGQTLLLTAPNDDSLILRHRRLKRHFPDSNTLADWAMPVSEQIQLKTRLAALAQQEDSYADLLAVGIPASHIRAALEAAAQAPPVSLSQSLAPIFAESARHLYLGKVEGQSLSLLRLPQALNAETIAALNHSLQCRDCLRLLDKREALNRLFAEARDQAAWLKIGSLIAAWALLCALFGGRQGSLMLLIPLAAAAATIALFAWWQMPLGLFAMFGLLLAAAIGMDYTVYAFSIKEALPQKCAALCLAAGSSGISFVLLCFSQTPAVAAFGAAVALGIAFNVLLTLIFLIKREAHDRYSI